MKKNSNAAHALRIKNLQKRLEKEGVDACLIENPLDLFYFTGLQLSLGRLFVGSKGAHLFVDGRYVQLAEEKAPIPASLESGAAILDFLKSHSLKRIGFDGQQTSYDRFFYLSKKYPEIEWVPETAIFKTLRLIKDADEIDQMKKSAQLCWKGFEWILSALKIGITEKEIAKGFEIFCLQQGADRLSFSPIIAFGVNGAMPHYHPQDIPLQEDDPVLIDIGVVLNQYHSDMTRVVFPNSQNTQIHHFYTLTQQAQKKALALCRPGIKIGTLDAAVREVFRKENVEHLFVHSLGHGIGLETHEFPRIKYDTEDKDLLLEPGMVFTIEPGLYLPGAGGVRYEDTIVITDDGYENFYPE